MSLRGREPVDQQLGLVPHDNAVNTRNGGATATNSASAGSVMNIGSASMAFGAHQYNTTISAGHPGISVQNQAFNGSGQDAQGLSPTDSFLAFCINSCDTYKVCSEIPMLPIRSDAELFLEMKTRYLKYRGWWSRFNVVVKPTTIEFIQVLVLPNPPDSLLT